MGRICTSRKPCGAARVWRLWPIATVAGAVALGVLWSNAPAHAQCAPAAGAGTPAPGTTVTCSGTVANQNPPNGYGDGSQNGLTINVLSAASVTGTGGAVAAGIAVNNNNTINNSGTISGFGPVAGSGISGGAGLTVTNAIGAAIVGNGGLPGSGDGIDAQDAIVTNSGSVQGAIGAGIATSVGAATVTNNAGATITGAAGPGIVAATNANVTNSGTITGSTSGIVANGGAANVINNAGGTIQGPNLGISATANATVNNAGTVSTSALGGIGVLAGNGGSGTANVTNSGLIQGTGASSIGVHANGTVILDNSSSGTIAENASNGIDVHANGNIFVTNSGTLAARGNLGEGVAANGNVTLTNSGTVIADGTGGIAVGVNLGNVTVSNAATGTITGTSEAIVGGTGSNVFNAGTITGTSGTAIVFSGTGNVLTLAPTSVINGNVIAGGTDTFQLGGSGNGAFDLSKIGAAQQYQGFTTFNVVGGAWTVSNTFGQTQAWNVNGGTLAGTGTLKAVNVNNGGALSPGTPGAPGTAMTINGNLAFTSGALYVIYLNPTTSTIANVAGTASLAGTVQANLASGTYTKKSYDILHSAGLGGTTFNTLVLSNPNFSGSLSYTGTDVFLNLAPNLGGATNLNQNQQNVANALNNFFNSGGTLPPQFASVFGLTGGSLANALSQLDGEAATGAERAVFQLTTEFLGLMLDPFVNGRGNGGGGAGGPALGFAPEQRDNLPPDIALAYASILTKAPPQSFEQRWSAWGSAFGGSNRANGDPVVGSNNTTASTFGFAGGMDYHVTPYTVVGFALAGAGTNWGLANALGTGRSDALQAGAYGISWFGSAYIAGALSFSNHWFTTNRSALGDALTANFVGQGYGARLEGGYRYAVLPAFAVTPYGAVQFQDFHTPAYSESDTTGGGLGLAFASMNATDVRSELGARFDDPTVVYNKPLILFGRLAWAHDFVSNPALSAAFQALPGGTFTVNGAPIPQNSALTTAGAQLFLTPQWTLLAKFEGEFASGSQTYAGTGTLRYTW
jgi:uncharacterized protein with beta-barrel porin domain